MTTAPETRPFIARFRRSWLAAQRLPDEIRLVHEADCLRELAIRLASQSKRDSAGELRELIECARFAMGGE